MSKTNEIDELRKPPYSSWDKYFKKYHPNCYYSIGIKRDMCKSYYYQKYMNSGIPVKWINPSDMLCSAIVRPSDGKVFGKPVCDQKVLYCLDETYRADVINGHLHGVTQENFYFNKNK